MKKPRQPFKKKNPGCPKWIVDGVRAIREAAAQRPIAKPAPPIKNGSTASRR